MLYEIWIDNFRLPVIPKEINPYEENEVSSVTIDGFGEISKTTNLKVRTFELSSFFMIQLRENHHMQKSIQ